MKFHYWIFGVIGVLCLLPIMVVLFSSLGADPEVWQHLRAYQFPKMLGNTLMLGAGVVSFSLILGGSLAWLVSMYEFRGRAVLEWLLVLPLAVPTYVMALAQLGIFDYTGVIQTQLRAWTGADVQAWFALRTPLGVSWVMSLALYPYVYLLARVAFRSMGARALEVGQSLGYSPMRSFWSVALPMARPWLASGAMLVLMEAWADFGAVSIFNYSTLTTGVYQAWFSLFSLPNALKIAAIALLMVFVLVSAERYWRGQRQYMTLGTSRMVRRQLSGWGKWLAFAWLAWVLCFALILPLAQLLAWALPSIQVDLNADFFSYVRGSVGLAAMAAFCTAAVALLLAIARRYAQGRWSGAWVSLFTMGYAVPGTVLAVGVYLPVAYLDNGLVSLGLGNGSGAIFKGTLLAMMWAYVVRFLAVGFSSTDGALQRISRAHEYVARSLGFARGRLLAFVYVPMMRSGLWTAWLMVFIDVMKEMPITLMMRPMGWDTLSVRIFALTSEGMWREAALPALSLVAVGVIPVLLLLRGERR